MITAVLQHDELRLRRERRLRGLMLSILNTLGLS
jgi:hypothetical protein